MKTLVKNTVSLFLVADATPIKMGEMVEVGEPVRYIIDNKDGLIQLYENVIDPPENYKGKRFCYDGKKWTTNNNWRDPSLTARKR